MSTVEKMIRQALENGELSTVVDMAARDRKVLSRLVRLAYAKDTLVGWRAILAFGMAARELAEKDAAFLRETCRKLLWSLTDESGGIGWSAPELLGEIVSADPRQFADIVPLIANVYEIEEDVFRAGVLYALGRIATGAPELALVYQKIIVRSLSDKDALVRFRGIELAGLVWPYSTKNNAWSPEFFGRIRSSLEGLRNDHSEVWIYGKTGFESVLVAEAADNAVIIVG